MQKYVAEIERDNHENRSGYQDSWQRFQKNTTGIICDIETGGKNCFIQAKNTTGIQYREKTRGKNDSKSGEITTRIKQTKYIRGNFKSKIPRESSLMKKRAAKAIDNQAERS